MYYPINSIAISLIPRMEAPIRMNVFEQSPVAMSVTWLFQGPDQQNEVLFSILS